MSGRDRVVLARDASARLRSAACKDMQALWDQQERAHGDAQNQAAAAAAAQPLLTVCRQCPVVLACEVWAKTDSYTGIAAGSAWVAGHPRPVHAVRRRRPLAS